jgi:hypothetical protein
MPNAGPPYHGSCHCGAVRFEIDMEPTEAYACYCSLCRRRSMRVTTVPENRLRITKGEDMLGLYQWNTGVAQHRFCRNCGIYVFHRKRSWPDMFGVNLGCLDDFDSSSLPFRKADGLDMTVESNDPRPEWTGPRVR